MAAFNIVEASIDELQTALSSGILTSVELVALYLHRISTYDCRSLSLNSIPILNNAVFEEAAASDFRRAAGQSKGALEGIPYTVKDSYLVKGMTAACGSPAFEHFVAQDDAFTVSVIRAAGGIVLGRTNMPPMAYGGMQRGIYGRAESPYNLDYLPAAFWSGSSNGSAVATAASFAAFGMGEETVSSGRSPASNNGLIAYTPSRGWISIRGNWPLYPTCDVVVPHTRTMADLLTLLDVITIEDPITEGDFWRNQPFVKLERPSTKGVSSFVEIAKRTSLSGLQIAVPAMYIGGPTPAGAHPIQTCPEVIELWEEARRDLESLGAEIIVVADFPLVSAYENSSLLPEGCPRLPAEWHASERGPLIAHGWNDFLRLNNDPKFPNIASVDPANIYPESMRTSAELKVIDRTNAIHFPLLDDYTRQSKLHEVEDIGTAITALEGMRKYLLEDWLVSLGCDCVAFPAAGDVAAADSDADDDHALYARQNGVFYSNGNKALRHLGVPTVSVPMGTMKDKKMPMNLTFAGKAHDDVNLLSYGNAYECKTWHRIPPPLTPALACEIMQITNTVPNILEVCLEGTIITPEPGIVPEVEIIIDATPVDPENIKIVSRAQTSSAYASFHFSVLSQTSRRHVLDERLRTLCPVARDKTMIVVLARAGKGGRPSGWLQVL
ncbi:amidase signature enzyme [Pleomassaria siparia CBS 279.74]|uniref:Amidase signature enzyme n=1 Tax=Pleomassaria siparia CBS 279.74 TaxID=1314801 RepID=A0A6G1JSI4_9PLEO|nr:amidase signature enzyme [Pleomassaria siparia CBS 279.74]